MSIATDVRYALRLLTRSPIFTITSVLSLAIAVAATTAIFSLADAILLRPRIGVAEPATLVDIGRTTNAGGFDNFAYPLFEALRDRSTLFSGLAAVRSGPEIMALGDAKSSERVFVGLVSSNYFDLVGTKRAAGRFFVAEEDRTPGVHPVVVLSHEFWKRRFASDPAIVGQPIRLNNLPYTVVGIAEEGFVGTSFVGADLWAPMAMEAHVRASDRSLLDQHNAAWMVALGRLKPGVTPEQARDELSAILRSYFADRGDDRGSRWGIAVAVSSRIPAAVATPVIGFVGMLGALTSIVLLIASSNIAAMLLARALERRREVATRLAIGASRTRILGQLLIEGLTLAMVAGVLSVPLASALIGLLSSFQPSLPLPLVLDLRVDPRVIAFAFVLAASTAVLFALLPALQATRFEVAPALHGQHATTDRRRAWLRHGLVTMQIAMALLLLVAAGLFMRSMQAAATADVGIDVRNVDLVQLDTRIGGYRLDADGMRVVESLLERFRQVPGVTSVGASRMVPLQGGGLGLGALRAPGHKGPDGTDEIDTDWDTVSAGYFETLNLRIVQGRPFTDRDRAGAAPVAIVNEHIAAQLWPGQNAVGQRLIQQSSPTEQRTLEVVGVARTAKYRLVGEPPRNFIYVPLAQQFMSEITFYARRGEASRIADLRTAVIDFDPNLPVVHTQTLEAATSIALLPQRLAAWVAGSVGSIGLFLAALGLYGLTAFSVAQRTREFAVRMALGATREDVLRLVLRQSGRLATAGIVIGLALAAGVSQLLGSLLINIGTIDPLAFGIATLILLVVLLSAAWTPARRASAMDPVRALRAE
jgi:predicted permease